MRSAASSALSQKRNEREAETKRKQEADAKAAAEQAVQNNSNGNSNGNSFKNANEMQPLLEMQSVGLKRRSVGQPRVPAKQVPDFNQLRDVGPTNKNL